ncbi:AAA family ATPase [Myxococcus sp. AB056]|uniref:AAA family ATPase n=1 Tax=Myxococcaceae TaxID=31 RepID=UPI00114784F6|nr:AAA family ATPase [Myxococcus sp. AB056]
MQVFQSEIRPTQVNALISKVRKRNYEKYLMRVVLEKVRGFENQVVNFDFPVTALIGPNGGGKTTILGAAGCAYKIIKPQMYFAKSGTIDDSMQDWRIEYELIDRDINQKEPVRRSSSFRSYKWKRESVATRDVVAFGISRTVPANERREMRQYASTKFEVGEKRVEQIEKSALDAIRRILGKEVSGYTRIRVDERGRVSMLAGTTGRGARYSEFHFGAGESSIIRMVMATEATKDGALILIEEIENGLHPVATVRMVEYLIDVAERKKVQAIFTTHSNDALKPLPSDAIWASLDGKVFQGKLDIHALRTITGQIEAKLAIFTEDTFASDWVMAMLRSQKDIAVDHVEVHSMAGDGTAVKINENHNKNPAISFSSVCFIDGDSQQKTSDEGRVYRLPGECPEEYVYDQVMAVLENKAGILAVALHMDYEDQQWVSDVVRSVRHTNMDPHLLFSQVGRQLRLLAAETVRRAFLSVWASSYPEEVKSLLAPLRDVLPAERK